MRFKVYSIKKVNGLEWKYTSSIDVDLSFWFLKDIQELLVIDNNFSIGHAESLVCYLEQHSCNALKKIAEINYNYQMIRTREGFSAHFSRYAQWRDSTISSLQGKLLLFEELSQHLIPQNLQVGYLFQEIKLMSSILYPYDIDKGNLEKDLLCRRCGSSDNIQVSFCKRCNDYCATCENCIKIGRSKTCSTLIYFDVSKDTKKIKIAKKSFTLNTHQQQISDKAVQFINGREKKQFLIWAVTGAGKTEMIFSAVTSALEMGYRVLFTVPRKDVIIDLIPRFKQAFPDIPIVSLYSGSNEQWNSGSLYLATTHQTIRFANFFDFIILDEMDAYPYQNNTNLQFYVKRSLKEDGQMLMMTATPPKKWLGKVKQGNIDFVLLPLRYHKHPLPVPKLIIIPKKEKIIKCKRSNNLIEKFVNKVKEKDGQALIFVSKVNEVKKWTECLEHWYANEVFVGVHANDDNRDKKIEHFKQGKYRFLVTTTILERGVTVPNLHVLVIGADAKIFCESTLVQIAGRVGRSSQFPTGLVWFLAETMTNDLIKARAQINNMNKLAKKTP